MHQSSTLNQIIDRFDAPFFFYDLDLLVEHLTSISKILDPDIKLWYACKANPMSGILKVLRNLNFGIDFASSGELHQILNTGINPKETISTGPAKSKNYLTHLIKSGVRNFVLESHNQVKWLNEVCLEHNVKAQGLLRLQLDWQDGQSVLGGNAITPFGLDHNEWLGLKANDYPMIDFLGFHIFQWGNILDLARLEDIWDKSIIAAKNLASELNIKMEIIDLGGGLGVPYNFNDQALSFLDVHTRLITLKHKHQLSKIWMELGRFAVADCGQYFTKIVDIKKVRGKNILVTEGGINHIARPALTGQAFPCTSLREIPGESQNFNVHGPLCTALDFLGSFELPANLMIGDWLVFHKAGAYGFTESMPYFLCHELAGEVIKYRGDLMTPRPPKTSYEWMI